MTPPYTALMPVTVVVETPDYVVIAVDGIHGITDIEVRREQLREVER